MRFLVFVFFVTLYSSQAIAQGDMRLYRLDCGAIHTTDLNVFSDTDQYIGQAKDLDVSCYLIKKGDNLLLWDTGIDSAIADMPEGKNLGVFKLKVRKTLVQQLAEIDLKPEDITHVGISHAHFDHAANVGLFKNATLIIQKAEFDFMKNTPEHALKYHMDAANFASFMTPEHSDQLDLLEGDKDIFGDGSVKAISLTGHTPGHMALMVDLPKTGKVILSGDQWHFNENRKHNGVPTFNYDRADTLASSDKLNHLVENNAAMLLIQHEAADEGKVPALPGYLE